MKRQIQFISIEGSNSSLEEKIQCFTQMKNQMERIGLGSTDEKNYFLFLELENSEIDYLRIRKQESHDISRLLKELFQQITQFHTLLNRIVKNIPSGERNIIIISLYSPATIFQYCSEIMEKIPFEFSNDYRQFLDSLFREMVEKQCSIIYLTNGVNNNQEQEEWYQNILSQFVQFTGRTIFRYDTSLRMGNAFLYTFDYIAIALFHYIKFIYMMTDKERNELIMTAENFNQIYRNGIIYGKIKYHSQYGQESTCAFFTKENFSFPLTLSCYIS